ncbi:adenosylmethionine--8-amino-7-oxononanoate transaminase [Helicobacter sp. MIT 14-3879]|uniref:adenosylmethionine--8-amino-7-oxononanoate transaminase n=1 Tax=Helicobacter sp. MIT 14-3879 TaxID=2040649 RepID=UPI000E1FA966|nr:adenosylmethionine--8-amino-7-oxononanoate transaminase [Helicobacter sp. MIT 14-3879]RDU65196.1 adenosylmethionine--8-amino-7-oxononanoate transaminase [Helicobacter sp. MIT 14-3879]
MNIEFKIKSLISKDLEFIWHPCTQMKDMQNFPIMPIKRGKGVYLYDFYDKPYVDCISSWWVNLFGHSNDYINSKLKEQLDLIEHIIFAGYTYDGIANFSKRLISKLPLDLNKCFYGDNGSSAVEIALKMSYHLNAFKDKYKNIFLSLNNSYHGETIGALSVGDIGIYKDIYNRILLHNIQAPLPKDFSIDSIKQAIESFKNIIVNNKNNICAFILEPLVQCAGGMNIYSSEFIKEVCKIARENDIYVIFDEIAVGFGRSGEMFALEECDFVPDFLCLSKGITGGYMPLSVVVTSDLIYNAFYGEYSRAFLHSHSYTGNPLAISCANAVMDIFENDNIIENNKILSKFIFEKFLELKEFNIVSNIRHKGMIFAFDLVGEFDRTISLKFARLALREGLIIRPLGKVVYFMPPYIISKEQVSFVIEGLKNILKSLC